MACGWAGGAEGAAVAAGARFVDPVFFATAGFDVAFFDAAFFGAAFFGAAFFAGGLVVGAGMGMVMPGMC